MSSAHLGAAWNGMLHTGEPRHAATRPSRGGAGAWAGGIVLSGGEEGPEIALPWRCSDRVSHLRLPGSRRRCCAVGASQVTVPGGFWELVAQEPQVSWLLVRLVALPCDQGLCGQEPDGSWKVNTRLSVRLDDGWRDSGIQHHALYSGSTSV